MKNSVTEFYQFILNRLSGLTGLINWLGSGQDFSTHLINELGLC